MLLVLSNNRADESIVTIKGRNVDYSNAPPESSQFNDEPRHLTRANDQPKSNNYSANTNGFDQFTSALFATPKENNVDQYSLETKPSQAIYMNSYTEEEVLRMPQKFAGAENSKSKSKQSNVYHSAAAHVRVASFFLYIINLVLAGKLRK